AGAAAIGMGVLPAAAAEEGYLKLLPALAALRTQVVVIRRGQSFSGRELLCQEEAGLVQDVGGHLDLPGRAVAAVVPKESLVALVFVSREVYHRAMAMQSEISVRRAVDSCCRLPFLRHTPLKELYRLSRYLQEITFQPGEVVLNQGRENGFIYFLVSGEVQVVLDLPDTSEPLVLAAAMAALSSCKLTPQQAQALAAHVAATPAATGYGAGRLARDSIIHTTVTADGTAPPNGGAAPAALALAAAAAAAGGPSGSGGSQSLPSFGVTRRIVLGRRGSGVVLGDDLLREKRLTVGVVATSRCVCLAVSPQRFTMCCDPLTLRLFHKLRVQHSATALFTDSLVQQEDRAALGAMFREAVLTQSYGPASLKRLEAPEPKAWKAPNVRPEEIAIPADQVFQQRPEHKTVTNASSSSNGGTASSSAAVTTTAHSGGGAGGGRGSGGGSTGQGLGASSAAQTSHTAPANGSTASAGPGSLPPGAVAAVDGSPPRLYGGLTVSLVQGLVGRGAEVGSMATFLQRIKTSEADALALPGGSGGRDGQLGPRDLDMSQQMRGITAQPQKVYTDMHEAACMAVIKVELAPGQLDVRLDPLAQVLDDIVVQWSDLAHRWGLQLVRWRTHDYFLVTPLDTATSRGGKRSRVRIVADTLLSMAAEFRRIVAQNEIPHLSMCAGMAIGGLFSSYDSGHFLVHCSGQAYTAAQHLCRMACEESHWQGTLLVADSVAQALSRTHKVTFSAGGSVLVGAVGGPPGSPRTLAHQPTGRSIATSVGLDGDEDDEPVSQGTRPYFKRGGDGGGGSRRLLLTSSMDSGRAAHFLRVDTEGHYLDEGDPYGGEDYDMGSGKAGRNLQHALSSNHRTLPRMVSVTASLPHLSNQHSQHTLTPHSTGTQQQRSGRRYLSNSLSAVTSGISNSGVENPGHGNGNGGSCVGSPRSPRGLRHTTIRLAPLGSPIDAADSGAEPSSRSDDPQYHNRQQSTRRPMGQSEPRVSFHSKQALLRHSGDGSSGTNLRSSMSGTSPVQISMSRLEETGSGAGAEAGTSPAAASVAASTMWPHMDRTDKLCDTGSGVCGASTHDSQRSTGVGLRLTANAHRRERIAAGNAMSYRQQLLQEITQLRHQNQEPSPSKPSPQLQQSQQLGSRRGRGRQGPPGVSESGYMSDVEGSVGSGRSPWREAGGAAAKGNGSDNGNSNGTSSARVNKSVLRSLSPSAAAPPLAPTLQLNVEQTLSPSPVPAGLQQQIEQQAEEQLQPQTKHQQQDESVAGANVLTATTPPMDTAAVLAGPDSSLLHVNDATQIPEPIELRRCSLSELLRIDRTSVDGVLSGAGLVVEEPGGPPSEARAHPLSQSQSPVENEAVTQYPEPTSSPPRCPSFSPAPKRSSGSSVCLSPIMGLTSKPPHSPGRVRVVSPEKQQSPRAPSPGYVTAAVRAVEVPDEVSGGSGRRGGGSSSGGSGSSAVAVVAARDTGGVNKGVKSPTTQLAVGGPDVVSIAAAAAAAAAAAGAPLLTLPARPIGVPSRRAPLGTQRPTSPYIPFSAIDPTSDAAVVARGGSPPLHTGPPGTAGTVSYIPKLVACNYGYLQIPSKSRTRSSHGSAVRHDVVDGDGPSGPEVTVLRNIVAGGSGTYSRNTSANAFGESAAWVLHVASRPTSVTPASGRGTSPVPSTAAGGGSGGSGGGGGGGGGGSGVIPQIAADAADPGAESWAGIRRLPGSSLGTPSTPKTPSRGRGSGPTTVNAALVSRQCSPPPLSAASGGSGGGGGPGSGGRTSSSRRRGGSWQDLGSQRAAEQYAASLPLGLVSVSFSTAGLSRVPPLQRMLYLESLALSYNHLVELASEQVMGLSQNLKVLTLVSADLDELPPDLGTLLPGLVELNLCSNRLVSLPPTIGSMTRLRSLSVAHNQLTSLPTSLYNLATLEHLLLQYNRLTVIDEALGNLRQLQALDLGFNRITQLPNETTALGGCLTRLAMPYNQLEALPPGFLLSMTHLAVLALDFNPHLASDPQLGGGRGSSKIVNGAADAPADAVAVAAAATSESFRSRSPSRLAMSSAASRGTASGPPGAPSTEQSMGTELSFAPLPDPTAPSVTTLSAPLPSGGSLQEGLSVSTSVIVASTSALSNLLKASAAPGAAAPMPMSPLPPTPTSPAPGAGPTASQMLPALRVLSLSAVQLVQVPSWIPAGLQVLDLSRNNLRRMPAWLCRRLAPSLTVLRLHTNRLESLPSEIRTMSQLQLLSLEENPLSSPERIATPQGAGWAAEWLYRKKYRSRPEILASLVAEHTGLTGAISGLAGGASTVTMGAVSTDSFAVTGGAGGGGGSIAGGSKSGAASAAVASVGVSSGMGSQTRSLRRGVTGGSNTHAAA
ncbi:hypothetical protein Vafri_11902, partial [Volvox africanus]